MTLHVGIDVGGTFTDAFGVVDGVPYRGKAFSTADVATGILDALDVLREEMGSGPEFFSSIDRLVLGSTIVTNAVDEQKYAAVGLLTTRGFRDTLRIARSARGVERDPHLLTAPPEVVDRRRIVEVTERIDAQGTAVIPLTEAAVAEAVEAVLAAGAETIAVCLLWSFRNPRHEELIGEYVARHHPDVPVSLSSAITPVYREYERMVTTTLDAAVKPAVADHFDTLSRELSARGLRTRVQVMQVHGGFLSISETGKAPISMFNSGPVGGVTGAALLGERLGLSRVLTLDMGGTSLDAAAIVDGRFSVLPRAEIAGLATSLTAVDIVTIGAGGGSLAWVDGRGVVRVGPHSAGSTPGPACYGRGGDRPTVTDAALALGLIDPDYYVGGTVSLDPEAARQAIRTHVGEPAGLSDTEAAGGICRLATTQIANAVRRITVHRGHDPREFSMVAFGGACGLFASAVAEEIGVTEILVPRHAAVFSAHGLLHSDSVYSAVQTTPWTMSDPADDLEAVFAELEARAQDWFAAEEVPDEARELVREADIKFAGQIFEVTTRLPAGPLTEATKDVVRERFVADYEAEFGAGTAWTEADLLVVNARARAIAHSELQKISYSTLDQTEHRSRRTVHDPRGGEAVTVDVHRGVGGTESLPGPCLVEEPDTTVWVPQGWSVRVADGEHFALHRTD